MTIPMILGPTGVGKTELLLEIGRSIPIEVVSIDSRQIYKYMDIGTAKPDERIINKVPHHMIDFVEPDEEFNVFKFKEMAEKTIDNIIRKNKIPVPAGGTGMYAEALMSGLVKNTSKNTNVRKALRIIDEENPGILRKLLKMVDNDAFEKFHEHDKKRTIRYLEVFLTTGKPLSILQKEAQPSKSFTVIILNRDRKELHERINRRVDNMLEKGLLQEVKSLRENGFSSDLNAMQSIGYNEINSYLDGKLTWEEAVELIKRNTRRFARRQIIWFRRYKKAIWFNLTNDSYYNNVESVKSKLLSIWGDKND
ncbi:MAG: tRNA (adenosine(37)-N6)-dimethylallyltransferase MiaA [Thermotogota bacterium]|nr:tRNA (adenosine(37)-N6)-dimethylallyltransferase MiaA [Thermotogota bacterium]